MAQFYSAKQRVTTQQRITVTIEDLDPFGQGVARYKGKTLFVSGALPGEQAEVTLLEDKRQSKAVRLLNHSPSRVAPRCPHFSRCGGCQQQHVDEALQQQSKSRALARMLTQAANQPVASRWRLMRSLPDRPGATVAASGLACSGRTKHSSC